MTDQNTIQLATEILTRPEFWARYQELAETLSPQLTIEAVDIADAFLKAAMSGTLTGPLPVRWQAMLAVAMNHVIYQTPLFFSDELAFAWDGFTGGMTAYCPRDGYRVPLSVARCPICGANTIAVEPSATSAYATAGPGSPTNIPIA